MYCYLLLGMDVSFWTKACNRTYSQSVDNAILANTISSSFTVASFIAAALFSFIWLARWLRLKSRNNELLGHVWSQLGWFSALVFVGCLSGVVAWSANIPSLALYYEARDPAKAAIRTQYRTILLKLSAHASWVAVFLLAQGLETLCLTLAKILVIGRLVELLQSMQNVPPKRRAVIRRAFHCVVVAVLLCGLTGISASIAGSYYKLESGSLALRAAEACDASGASTAAARAIARDTGDRNKLADQVIAVQNASEMTAMLIIVASYLVIIPSCLFSLRITKVFLLNTRQKLMKKLHMQTRATDGGAQSSAAAANAKAQEMIDLTIHAADGQQKRLVVINALIFLTFQPRAVYAVIQAIGNTSTELNTSCGVCGACQSVYLLVNLWLRYTPQFRAIAVMISSPLPLSASLWFMMSSRQRLLLATAGESAQDDRSDVEKAAAFARHGMHIDLPVDAAPQKAPLTINVALKSTSASLETTAARMTFSEASAG